MYNDSISLQDVNELNKKIEIYYWEYPGAEYADFNDLTNAGFHVINGNSYYLYFVPCKSNTGSADLQYSVNDISENWTPDMWNEIRRLKHKVPGTFWVHRWQSGMRIPAESSKKLVFKRNKSTFNAMSSKLDAY